MPRPPPRLRHFRVPVFLLALVLLSFVGFATAWGVQDLTRNTAWVEHSYEVLNEIERTQSAVRAAESAGRGYRLTDQASLQADFLSEAPKAVASGASIVSLTRDNPQQNARARTLHSAVQARLVELQRLLDLQNAQGMRAAQEAMRIGNSILLTQHINDAAEDLRSHELVLLEARHQRGATHASILIGFVAFGIVLSLGLLGALIMSLNRENRRARDLEASTRGAMEELEITLIQRDQLSEQRRRLGVYSGMLQSCQSRDEAMELTANTIEDLMPHVGGRCYLSRASQDHFETAATFGRELVASHDVLRAEECWALRRGQPHHTDGVLGRMRCSHIEHGSSLTGIATLCVPLAAQNSSLGMLYACAPADGGPMDNDAALLESIAEQLGMALANLQLRETLRTQSLRDPLTGLFNRRYLEENLQRELQRCQRKGLPLSVLMIDVDHFKRFNDQQGHAAGDAVLAHVGRTLQALVRAEDLACRYGGEEFTVIMPEADARIALDRAEAIRRAISATTVVHLKRTLGPVTASIGVSTFPTDGATPEVLLEVADAALYRAKAEGRDRVLHAAPLG